MSLGTECQLQRDLRHEQFKRRESIREQKSREVPTGLPSTKNKTVRYSHDQTNSISYSADGDLLNETPTSLRATVKHCTLYGQTSN